VVARGETAACEPVGEVVGGVGEIGVGKAAASEDEAPGVLTAGLEVEEV